MQLGFCSLFFNLRGTFKHRGNPSLLQSLSGPDTASRSPRPQTLEDTHTSKEGPTKCSGRKSWHHNYLRKKLF